VYRKALQPRLSFVMHHEQRMRFHATTSDKCEEYSVEERWMRVLTSDILKLLDLNAIHPLGQVGEGYTSRSGAVA
jgi:hypothetical protein